MKRCKSMIFLPLMALLIISGLESANIQNSLALDNGQGGQVSHNPSSSLRGFKRAVSTVDPDGNHNSTLHKNQNEEATATLSHKGHGINFEEENTWNFSNQQNLGSNSNLKLHIHAVNYDCNDKECESKLTDAIFQKFASEREGYDSVDLIMATDESRIAAKLIENEENSFGVGRLDFEWNKNVSLNSEGNPEFEATGSEFHDVGGRMTAEIPDPLNDKFFNDWKFETRESDAISETAEENWKSEIGSDSEESVEAVAEFEGKERQEGKSNLYGSWYIEGGKKTQRRFVFRPNADAIPKLAPDEVVTSQLRAIIGVCLPNFSFPKPDGCLEVNKEETFIHKFVTIIISVTINGQEPNLEFTWNSNLTLDDQMRPGLADTSFAAHYPDLEGTINSNELNNPQGKLVKLIFETYETPDQSPDSTSFESCRVGIVSMSSTCWRWESPGDFNDSVGGISGITGTASHAGLRNLYGSWYVENTATASMHTESRKIFFRPTVDAVNGLSTGTTITSYLKITFGYCTASDGRCTMNRINQLDADYGTVTIAIKITGKDPTRISIINTPDSEVDEGDTAMFRISSDTNPSETDGILTITVIPTVTGKNFLVNTWGTKGESKFILVRGFTQPGGIGPFIVDFGVPTSEEKDVFSGNGTIGLMLTKTDDSKYEVDSDNSSASVTVRDTNSAPNVSFHENSVEKEVNEQQTVILDISMTGKAAQVVNVSYTITEQSVTSGDYRDLNNGTIEIGAGRISGEIAIAITADNDDTEEDESFEVKLNSASMGSVQLEATDPKSATITIAKTEIPLPELSISAVATQIKEGSDAKFLVSANLKEESNLSFVVLPTFTGFNFIANSFGSANSNVNLDLTFSQTNGAGAYSAPVTVPTISNVGVYGGNGKIKLTLLDRANYTVATSFAEVTVNDDVRTAPEVGFRKSDSLTVKHAEGKSFDLNLDLSGGTVQDVVVDFSVISLTATAEDYAFLDQKTAIISRETLVGVIAITIVADNLTEVAETFSVRLDSASVSNISLPIAKNRKSSTITIRQNSGSEEKRIPEISINIETAEYNEGESVTFTLHVNPPPRNSLTVLMKVALSENWANALFFAPSIATIPANSNTANYTVATMDNSEKTGDITINVSIYERTGYKVRTGNSASVRIIDNDIDEPNPAVKYSLVVPIIRSIILRNNENQSDSSSFHSNSTITEVSISAVDPIVEEGKSVKFLIESNSVIEDDLSVQISLRGGEGIISGNPFRTAVIQSGKTRSNLLVKTLDDGIAEQDGVLTAALLKDSNYTVSNRNSATVTISDEADRYLHRQQLSEANRTVLPQVLTDVRTVSMNTTIEHLTKSMNGEMETGISLGGRDSIKDLIMTGGKTLNGNWESLRTEIGNSSFVLNPTPEKEYASTASVWGVTEVSSLSGNGGSKNHSFRGEMIAGQIGITSGIGNGIFTGLSTELSEFEVKFSNESENWPEINYSASMTGIHPHFGYTSPDGYSRLQFAAGYGLGEIGIDQKDYATMYLDSSFVSTKVGGFQRLHQIRNGYGGFSEVVLTGDVWAVQQTVDSNDKIISGLSANASHFRVATEGRENYSLPDSSTISPSVELAVRGDTLDRKRFIGMNLVGSANYKNNSGLDILGWGEAFLATGNTELQWKLKSSLKYDKKSDDIGLILSLSPYWTHMHSSFINSFQNNELSFSGANFGNSRQNYKSGLDSKFAYGVGIFDKTSVLTPYIEYSTENFLLHEFSVGNDLKIGRNLEIEVHGTRISSKNTLAENAVRLSGKLNW